MDFRVALLLAAVSAPVLGLPTQGRHQAPMPRVAQASELAFDVSVQRGRARLVQEEETHSLTSSDEALQGRGDAALGVGMGGRAEVAWRSRASLRIAGPAELEWGLRSAKGELQIIAGAAGGLELEARRMPVWLELSHGWRLRAREAALQIQELPTGGWSVKHHGGSAVRVLSRVPREEGSWPRVLVAGDEVRLEPREDEDDLAAGTPRGLVRPEPSGA